MSACTLSNSRTVDLTTIPSPSALPPTATATETATRQPPTATQTKLPTATTTNTPIPPSSTVASEPTIAPTDEPSVTLRPPNRRAYTYDSPDPNGQLVRFIQGQQTLRAVGRTNTNTWVEVEFADGVRSWVTASSVVLPVDINSLDITATILPQDFIVTVQQSADGLRLRELPQTGENILLYLSAGESLIVDGRLSDNVWLQVRRTNGTSGWVMRGFVDMPFDINMIPEVVNPVIFAEPTLAPTLTPNQPAPTAVPAIVEQETTTTGTNQATVTQDGDGLRLRELPNLQSRVFFNLSASTAVTVNARTVDSVWALVQTPAQGGGWVATQYLAYAFDLNAIPAIEYPQPVYNALAPEVVESVNPAPADSSASVEQPTVIQGVQPGSYQFQSGVRGTGNIYSRGQSLGNNPYLFTKVGDSLTATAGFLYQIGWNNYSLGEYEYLKPVIDHFGSSYLHTSKAMLSGWKSFSVLDPNLADTTTCQAGESPLQCEYRVTRPAFALILLGTNDVYEVPPSLYEAYMRDIIEISIDNGVVPIVSTVPLRLDFQSQVQAFNDVIRRVVADYDVPLWDLYNEVFSLPNHGLSSDNVHLSAPGGNLDNTANFTGGNLQFGMNFRNLSALRILETMLKTYVW